MQVTIMSLLSSYLWVLEKINMKKAYLVTFSITTRVITEKEGDPYKDDDVWNDIASSACSNLYEGSPDFGENIIEIEEDVECPYGTYEDD